MWGWGSAGGGGGQDRGDGDDEAVWCGAETGGTCCAAGLPGHDHQGRLRVPAGRQPSGPLLADQHVAAAAHHARPPQPRRQRQLRGALLWAHGFRRPAGVCGWGGRGGGRRRVVLPSRTPAHSRLLLTATCILLAAAATAAVVCTQSTKQYNAWKAYGASKLANVLFTYELARRLPPAANCTGALEGWRGGRGRG